jgi:glutathione S-transferase
MIAESGFITHKLITSYPSSSVENDATDDSVFWSHFSEGSLMTQLQLGISVMITSGAVAAGQMPGVEMSEEGRKAVGQYGKVLMVCPSQAKGMREVADD